MKSSPNLLISEIKQVNLDAFETLFNQYYPYLCLIANHIVRNQCDAEEIVSDVFIKLWNIKENLVINTSVKGYLVKAVHNTSLNYLERNSKNELTNNLSISDYKLLTWDSDYPLGHLYEEEILDLLDKGICRLPEGCREIFLLSRNENMKYSNIADKLGISVNTVKTQMKIALASLRYSLKEYLVVALIVIFF